MKISKVILSLILSLSMLVYIPVCAKAESFKTFKYNEKNFVSTGSVGYQKDFEDFFISAIENHISKIDVLRFKIYEDSINKILIDILNKYPEYFCVDLSNSSYNVYKSLVLQININYYFSKEACGEKKNEIEREIKKPLRIMNGLSSDEDKVLFAHDYIVLNNAYDEDGLSGDVEKVDETSFNAYGCLVLKKSVCQGMSDAFILLCRRAGINAFYVSSDEMCHAWNIVELNGSYYHLDITWDDSNELGNYNFTNINGACSHKYFLKSDSQFKRLSHKNWESEYTAEDSTTYSNAYWDGAESAVFFIKNYAYYLKNLSLIKRSFTDGKETVIYQNNRLNTGLIDNDSCLAYDYNGDYLFINLNDGIYAFDTKSEESFKVFEEKDEIIGIAFSGDALKYDSVSKKQGTLIKNSDKTAKIVFPREKTVYGDINGSGKFDISDILDLKKALIDNFSGLNIYSGDMNSDGKTDLIDLVIMRKTLSDTV